MTNKKKRIGEEIIRKTMMEVLQNPQMQKEIHAILSMSSETLLKKACDMKPTSQETELVAKELEYKKGDK